MVMWQTRYSVLRFYKHAVGPNLVTFHKPCLEAKGNPVYSSSYNLYLVVSYIP